MITNPKNNYRTSYTEENITRIENIISLTGNEDFGYQAAGIHPQTYQKWKREKPEFKALVEKAKKNYCQYSFNSLQIKALKEFYKLLTEGEVRTTERKRIQKDKQGNVIGETLEIIKETKSPPRWVIERVLPGNIKPLEAINTLIAEGIASPKQSQIVHDQMFELLESLRNAWEEQPMPKTSTKQS